MFVLGFVIFLLSVFLGAIILGGSLLDFINLPSLVLIIGPLVGVLIATKSFGVFIGGMKVVINPYRPLTEELRGQAASLFRLLSKTTALTSAIFLVVSFVNLCLGLDFSSEFAQRHFLVNIAALLIMPLYGMILIAGLFEPVVFNLKKRRDTERKG